VPLISFSRRLKTSLSSENANCRARLHEAELTYAAHGRNIPGFGKTSVKESSRP
jgi:hypothetical protein